MGSLSISHWLIVLVVILVLFGTGKVSSLMGDVATGIKAFKKNMVEDGQAPQHSAASIAMAQEPPIEVAARDTNAAHPG